MSTRREVIQLAALPLLMQAQEHHHNGAPADPELLRNYTPKFFGAEDFSALEAFTAILIPADETPGAKEARCAYYIDFVLQSAANQQVWRKAMEAIRTAGFHAADEPGRAALVEAFSQPGHACFAAFQLIKEQTAFAYYTSRVGLIEELDYRGNSYNAEFPACEHPEHHRV